MANGVINLTSTSSKLEGRIVWKSTSDGAVKNTSTVIGTLQVRRNDGYTTKGTWTGFLTVADTKQNFTNSSISVGSEWVTMVQVTRKDFPHANDGTSNCWINGECNAPSGTSLAGTKVSGSDTVTLDKIARYLNITSFEIRNITINTAQVFWSTDVPRNDTHYYLNNNTAGVGAATYGETVASDKKSGNFYVKGLSPNIQYSIKISCTRADNGLVTTTSNKTFSTYNIATLTQAPNFNIGENPTITWNNPGNCKTVVYSENIVNGNIESQLSSAVDVSGRTSYTYSLNAGTLYGKVPNSNSGTIRYVIRSSNDGKDYYASVDKTYYVKNSNPTFLNFTFKDTNSKTITLTGNNQKFIKGYSSLQATVSTANKAVAKNSATMKNYTLTVGTKNSGEIAYSSSADVNLSVNNIDNNVVFVTAKDSRQNTTAIQKTISNENYYTYSDLTITKCTLTRSDGGVGTEVTLNYAGTLWNKSFGSVTNAITSAKYEYKIAGESTWTTGTTTLSPTVSGNNYSQTILIQGDLAGSGFNEQNSYDFRLTISDKLSTKVFTTIFGAGTPLVAYHKNGVALKGKYDTSVGGALQVYNGDIWARSGNAIDVRYRAKRTDKNIGTWFGVGSGGVNRGIYDENLNKWIFRTDGTNTYVANSAGEHNINEFMRQESQVTSFDGNLSTQNSVRDYIKETAGANRPSELSSWGTIITCRGKKGQGYTQQIAIGNYSSNAGLARMAIRSQVDGQSVTSWEYLQNRPIVLYANSSGTTGTVTLSGSVTNFSYLEIFYKDTGGDSTHSSTKISSANGKIVALQIMSATANTNTRNSCRSVTLNGTNITTKRSSVYFSSASNNDWYSANEISIYKVLGYR